MFEILIIISLFVTTEIVVGSKAFKVAEKVQDGHGNLRVNCLNECGAFGDGWGSLKGFCTSCKHDADVGCKCKLHGCGEKYWSRVNPDRKYNMDGDLIA